MLKKCCDKCGKDAADKGGGINLQFEYNYVNLCKKCAKPIFDLLKKYKIGVPEKK